MTPRRAMTDDEMTDDEVERQMLDAYAVAIEAVASVNILVMADWPKERRAAYARKFLKILRAAADQVSSEIDAMIGEYEP